MLLCLESLKLGVEVSQKLCWGYLCLVSALQPCPQPHLKVATSCKACHPRFDFQNIKFQPRILSSETHINTTNMLRRHPTAITLTTEDIAIYEDARAREALLREQQRHQAQMQAQAHHQNQNQSFRDPADERLAAQRNGQREKTREERLGLMNQHGGGGSSRS